MFFATATHPQVRRQAYANAGQSLERFMGEALRASRIKPPRRPALSPKMKPLSR